MVDILALRDSYRNDGSHDDVFYDDNPAAWDTAFVFIDHDGCLGINWTAAGTEEPNAMRCQCGNLLTIEDRGRLCKECTR